jgi:hypothetical protein
MNQRPLDRVTTDPAWEVLMRRRVLLGTGLVALLLVGPLAGGAYAQTAEEVGVAVNEVWIVLAAVLVMSPSSDWSVWASTIRLELSPFTARAASGA